MLMDMALRSMVQPVVHRPMVMVAVVVAGDLELQLLLSYLFSYQIKNDRVGFPSSALDKIVNSLCEKHICVVVVGSEIRESVFDDN